MFRRRLSPIYRAGGQVDHLVRLLFRARLEFPCIYLITPVVMDLAHLTPNLG